MVVLTDKTTDIAQIQAIAEVVVANADFGILATSSSEGWSSIDSLANDVADRLLWCLFSEEELADIARKISSGKANAVPSSAISCFADGQVVEAIVAETCKVVVRHLFCGSKLS